MNKTAAEISASLHSLDRRVDDLTASADAIALQAVSGDEAARRSLADLLRQTEQVKAEKPILERALAQARLREAEAGHVVDAAARGHHMAEARSAATRLLAAGQQADEMLLSFLACMDEVQAAEGDIHRSLRAAGDAVGEGVIGQRNARAIACERMGAAANGKLVRLADQRSMSAILAGAWRVLIRENEND